MGRMFVLDEKVFERLRNEALKDPIMRTTLAAAGGVKEDHPWYIHMGAILMSGGVPVPDYRDPLGDKKKLEYTRYGTDKDGNKNRCLYTIKDENKGVIYFGVSRCDTRYDQFEKKAGRSLAMQRAQNAQSNERSGHRVKVYTPELGEHYAPLSGVAKGEYLKELLDWFDGLE